MNDCGHCGYPGELLLVKDVQAKEQDDEYGQIPDEYLWQLRWGVYRCPKCDKPTITEYGYVEARDEGRPIATPVIYPAPREEVPDRGRVRKRLEEARRAKYSGPNNYGTALRRVMEAVCNAEGATGKDLYAKTQDLQKRGILSERIVEVVDSLRVTGKLGAHDDDVDLEPEDVEHIERLTETVLDYVYRAPARMKAIRDAVASRAVSDAADSDDNEA